MELVSWLDLILIAFIIINLVLGYLQGFVQGVLALVGFALGLVAVLVLAPWGAALLDPITPWPPVLTLLVLAVIGLMATRLLTGLVIARLRLFVDVGHARVRLVDRLLGLLPGAVWGLGSAALVAWLYSAFLGPIPAHSPLATLILDRAQAPIQAIARRIPSSMPGVAMFPEGIALVPGPDEAERQAPPTQLEREMLDLVNAERKKAGVKPLVWDGRLAEVGRKHSQDMLAKDYFAHEAPDGSTVDVRVRRAGIMYLLVGENLAFAPSLSIAHRGLMQSPGHRENILRPGFGRVGIGIIRVPPGESYTPAVQGKRPAMPLRGTEGYLIVTQVFRN